uniref:Uncharacterized protein n=1 Tax=Arundo donax TaxID=35708 RepID=A0A0A9FDE2_ARUDO
MHVQPRLNLQLASEKYQPTLRAIVIERCEPSLNYIKSTTPKNLRTQLLKKIDGIVHNYELQHSLKLTI